MPSSHRSILVVLLAGLLAACATAPTPTPTSSPPVGPSAETASPTAAVPSPSSATPASGASPSLGAPSPSSSTAVVPGGPTGQLLFFRSSGIEGALNGWVWVVGAAGGPARRLGGAREASWSADGTTVHLVTYGTGCIPHLTTRTPDGQDRLVVRAGLRSEDGAFSWSPNDRRVVFARYHNGPPAGMCGSQGGAYDPQSLVSDIIVMNADGTGSRVLAASVWPGRSIVWSPDGTQIAFADTNGTGFVIVRVSNGERTQHARSLGRLGDVSWSPDGRRMAFVYIAPEQALHVGVMQVDGTGFRDLGGDTPREPVWTPDGSAIAVVHDVMSANGAIVGGGIELIPADGNASRHLGVTDVHVYTGARFEPDGRWIAYVADVTSSAGSYNEIGLAPSTGGPGLKLTTARDAEWVLWQPAP